MPDTLGFLEAVRSLPEQLATARAAASVVEMSLPDADGIEHVVVVGMGGSGIAGAVLEAVGADCLPVPLVLLQQLSVPAFVGPRTLVFALSYSGDTEETASMARSAQAQGASLVSSVSPEYERDRKSVV